MARFVARVAAQSFLCFGAVGLGDGIAQIVRFPYWFHSPLDRLLYVVTLLALYGAIGIVSGALCGVCGLALSGGRRPGPGADVSVALVAALFFFGGFLIHRDLIADFFSPVAVLASVALALLGMAAVGGIVRHERRHGGIPALFARTVCVLLVPGLVFATVRGGFSGGSRDGRPNILLIVIDTLRADRLSCYGNPRRTTPAIDRAAREGVLFVDAITPAPLTQPAVSGILTGIHPGISGVVNHPNHLAGRWSTLAEHLQDAGYRTAFLNTHPLLTHAWGFGQGWDEYRFVSDPARFDVTLLGQVLERIGMRDPCMTDRAATVTDLGIEYLSRNRSKPFFLYAHYIDPHFTYEPPWPFDRLFSPSGTPTLLNARLPDGRRDIFDVEAAPEDLVGNVDLYDGEIAYTDREIGRLLTALETLGLAGRTLVVMTGDHGEGLGEHGLFFAHTHYLYDSTQRVPLVLRLPQALPEGRVVREQVGLLDVAPTLLGLAGIEPPPEMRGRRLDFLLRDEKGAEHLTFAGNGRTILRNGEEHNPRWYVDGDDGMWRMARSGSWKLIRIPTPGGADFELYDLDEDPAETRNLAAARPDVLQSLRGPLEEWLAESGAAEVVQPTVDEQTLEGLRSLGYVQ